jgi:hypothetical protein
MTALPAFPFRDKEGILKVCSKPVPKVNHRHSRIRDSRWDTFTDIQSGARFRGLSEAALTSVLIR